MCNLTPKKWLFFSMAVFIVTRRATYICLTFTTVSCNCDNAVSLCDLIRKICLIFSL